MIAILDTAKSLSHWVWLLPPWVFMLLYGLLIAYAIAAGGYVLARTGVRPLWVLLLWVPFANIAALWVWAYMAWPAEKRMLQRD